MENILRLPGIYVTLEMENGLTVERIFALLRVLSIANKVKRVKDYNMQANLHTWPIWEPRINAILYHLTISHERLGDYKPYSN